MAPGIGYIYARSGAGKGFARSGDGVAAISAGSPENRGAFHQRLTGSSFRALISDNDAPIVAHF